MAEHQITVELAVEIVRELNAAGAPCHLYPYQQGDGPRHLGIATSRDRWPRMIFQLGFIMGSGNTYDWTVVQMFDLPIELVILDAAQVCLVWPIELVGSLANEVGGRL